MTTTVDLSLTIVSDSEPMPTRLLGRSDLNLRVNSFCEVGSFPILCQYDVNRVRFCWMCSLGRFTEYRAGSVIGSSGVRTVSHVSKLLHMVARQELFAKSHSRLTSLQWPSQSQIQAC